MTSTITTTSTSTSTSQSTRSAACLAQVNKAEVRRSCSRAMAKRTGLLGNGAARHHTARSSRPGTRFAPCPGPSHRENNARELDCTHEPKIGKDTGLSTGDVP